MDFLNLFGTFWPKIKAKNVLRTDNCSFHLIILECSERDGTASRTKCANKFSTLDLGMQKMFTIKIFLYMFLLETKYSKSD